MSREINDSEFDIALREGLRSIAVPVAGPDFDARVLGAMEKPQPWWHILRSTLKPAFGGAAFSLIATLLVVNWALKEPDKVSNGHNSGITTVSIEKALESPYLTSASLTRLRPIRSAASEPTRQPASREPAPIQIPHSKMEKPQLPRPGQTRVPESRSVSLV